MQTVQEIYQNVILSLPENEQLKLASLILEKVTSTNDRNQKPKTNGGSRETLGWWQGKEITHEEYLQLDHNEQIDFDLGRAYADKHEDEG